MELFHKLSKIISDTVWHTIAPERADICLIAIKNILVRSALDASAGKMDQETEIESPEMKQLKNNLTGVAQSCTETTKNSGQ